MEMSMILIFAALLALCALVITVRRYKSLDRSSIDYVWKRNSTLFDIGATILVILLLTVRYSCL